MSYPKELKEYPQLEEKTYPFRVFFNECRDARPEQNILFLHWHEHFEIIVMQKGSAIFHVDSKPYPAAPGDVLVVPSGGLHVGYSLTGGDIAFVSVVFHASLFKDRNLDSQHEQFVAPYLENRYQFPVKPAENLSACAAYYPLLESVINEVQLKGPAFQLVVKNQLHLFFTLLARSFPRSSLKEDSRVSGIRLTGSALSRCWSIWTAIMTRRSALILRQNSLISIPTISAKPSKS